MRFKTLISIFVLPLVPVVALTFALSTGAASVSASSQREKPLHVTKECLPDQRVGAWEFCTIKSSNLGRIKVDSRVYYVDPPNLAVGLQDSAVVLDAGDGNRALGRCTVDFATGLGLCTFSDGTGRFAGFRARVQVTPPANDQDFWHWDGTYSFRDLD
jgi:hypothetical protein